MQSKNVILYIHGFFGEFNLSFDCSHNILLVIKLRKFSLVGFVGCMMASVINTHGILSKQIHGKRPFERSRHWRRIALKRTWDKHILKEKEWTGLNCSFVGSVNMVMDFLLHCSRKYLDQLDNSQLLIEDPTWLSLLASQILTYLVLPVFIKFVMTLVLFIFTSRSHFLCFLLFVKQTSMTPFYLKT